MFGDRHELHMGEAHLFYVGDQIAGDVPVGEKLPFSRPPPGAQMDLINIQRTVIDRVLPPPVQPVLVAPFVAGQVVNLGGIARPGLGMKGVGVGLGQGRPSAVRTAYL